MTYISQKFDDRITSILSSGGVGFMPSDTIYGLSCQAQNEQAVERIYGLKARDTDKPLILLIATISQLKLLGINESEANPAKKYWPGSLTIICDAPSSPAWLHRGGHSLAVRIPDDDRLRELISNVGPLVSTSANTQGDNYASTVAEAKDYFGDQLDFYVDNGDLSDRQPSTLVRYTDGELQVIRPGAVKIDQ